MLASLAVQEVLLVLKIAFIVLLYLFIWRIVRSASRDLRLPQESFILSPSAAASAGLGVAARVRRGHLVVLRSRDLEQGSDWEIDSAQLTVGRGGQNDIQIAKDEFASARHARFEPRHDGIWLQDLGSTNGTYVNGAQIEGPRRLAAGDVVRIGETELRYDG